MLVKITDRSVPFMKGMSIVGLLFLAAMVFFPSCTASSALTPKNKVIHSYDEFSNRTSVRMKTMVLNNSMLTGSTLTLSFHADEKGKQIHKPDNVFMAFSYTGDKGYGWRFKSYHEIFILADDARFEFPKPSYSNHLSKNWRTESMIVRIGMEQLEKMATAEKLRLKIGIYEFKIRKSTKARIKEYFEYVNRLPEVDAG